MGLAMGCLGLSSKKKSRRENSENESLPSIDVSGSGSENEGSYVLRALSSMRRGAGDKAEKRIKKLPQYNKKHISSCYRLGEIIGIGGFSVVRHATRKGTKQKFACKIMKLPKQRDDCCKDGMSRKAMFNEVQVSCRVNSRNIACVEEFFVTKSKIYIVMDLMEGGAVLDNMASQKLQRYTEEDARCIFHQLLNGIAYLHTRNIAHRDLKLQNLMLVNKNDLSHIKIIDMGLAKQIMCMTNTSCGSPLFVAPEILSRSNGGHGLAVDIWSAGVILFLLLGGYTPFFADEEYQLFANIETCTYDFNDPVWSGISDSAKDLISHCLQLNPAGRIAVAQALSHEWLRNPPQEKKH